MKNIKEYVEIKKRELKTFFDKFDKRKVLVIIQLNDDPASNAYIRGKLKDCAEINVDAKLIKLSEETSEEILIELINKFNIDQDVDGIIVQMPLPKHIDEELIKRTIDTSKDVDGFNEYSKFTPATPKSGRIDG